MPEAPSFPPAHLQPSRRQPAHWFPVSRHARKAPARAPRQADHALRPHPLPLAPAEHPQSGLFARPRPLFMAILAACLALPASARTEEVSDQVPPAAATAGSPAVSGSSTPSRQAPVGTPLLLAQSSHAHGRATTLPAVTVHARKAEEKAKDLPFTVSVTDDVDLETRRITRMEDVLRGTPGVDVNSWGGPDSANVRIRGVGSLYLSGTDDNSVVVNVDGVPTSVSNVGLGTLDAEQIEVLKGPQGTLFGRSSTAGAIDVRSAPPVLNHFGGHVRGELGNDHHHLAEGVLNAPLGDTLAARIALRHSAQDLWYENSATGRPLSRPADLNARASLLWQPQAATQVLLRASRNTAKKYQSAMLARPYTSPPTQDLDTDSSIAGNERAINQYALEIRHDLPWARLTSVTGRENINHDETNLTGRRIMRAWMGLDTVFPQNKGYHSKGWNEDLRLSSPKGSDVFWVAGLNLYRNDWTNYNGYGGSFYTHDLTERSNALYGEATWPLKGTPLKLTTGLRHTRTRKTYSALYTPAGATTSSSTDRLSQNHTTGRMGLGWALDPQTSLYTTLSRGKKASGFNDNATNGPDSAPYAAGTVDSLELGAKHESADGTLRLDAAIFSNRVRNDHLLAFDPTDSSSHMVNADTRSRGLELNTRWRAGAGFTLSGGLTWLDGSIRSHAVTNTPAGDVNAGNRLPDVARLSVLLGVQWEHPLPAFAGLAAPTLDAALTVRHVGRRTADPQNSFDLDSYRKIDLHVGVTSGSTEVYLWGDNLLDERYDLYGYYFSPTLTVGMPSPGRSVGIGVTHHF